jgi:ligand-binding SRPBCC domain-containing protein
LGTVRHLELLTRFSATPETVFAASLSVERHVASMAATGERAVGGVTTGRLGLGDEVTWRARHLGRWWEMTSRITEYTAPVHFVDEQVAGPFAVWRHAHHFSADGDGTLMRDVVDYAAPFWPLGRLAEAVVLDRYLTRLLRHRNEHLAST